MIAALVLSLPNLETSFPIGTVSGKSLSNAPHVPRGRPLVGSQLYADESGIGTASLNAGSRVMASGPTCALPVTELRKPRQPISVPNCPRHTRTPSRGQTFSVPLGEPLDKAPASSREIAPRLVYTLDHGPTGAVGVEPKLGCVDGGTCAEIRNHRLRAPDSQRLRMWPSRIWMAIPVDVRPSIS
jgi:hypothetical protein